MKEATVLIIGVRVPYNADKRRSCYTAAMIRHDVSASYSGLIVSGSPYPTPIWTSIRGHRRRSACIFEQMFVFESYARVNSTRGVATDLFDSAKKKKKEKKREKSQLTVE